MKSIIFIATASFLTFFLFLSHFSYAQKKLLILGSSTSTCVGPTVPANCYVNRLVAYYESLKTPITVDNRAVSGWNVYRSMPETYIPPPDRDAPRDYFNITDAVAANPNAIIVNYPSNGYDVFSVAEVMNCFRIMKQTADAKGINCFITTTQPRDNFTAPQRDRLRIIKDSVLVQFGASALDFWTDVTEPLTNTIKPEYRVPGDPVHLNDAGHEKLFQRVAARNIFATIVAPGSLPLRFVNFKGTIKQEKVILTWKVADVINVSHFDIQKSTGNGFKSLGSIPLSTTSDQYQFTDEYPASGSNAYRIAVVDKDTKRQYSHIVNVIRSTRGLLEIVWTRNDRLIRINTDIRERVQLQLVNISGQVLLQRTVSLVPGINTIPVGDMQPSKGVYIFSVHGDQWRVTNTVSFLN